MQFAIVQSTRPNLLRPCAIERSTAASSIASTTQLCILAGLFNFLAQASDFSGDLPVRKTDAPSFKNWVAVAAPIPPVAPVISITLSSILTSQHPHLCSWLLALHSQFFRCEESRVRYGG